MRTFSGKEKQHRRPNVPKPGEGCVCGAVGWGVHVVGLGTHVQILSLGHFLIFPHLSPPVISCHVSTVPSD